MLREYEPERRRLRDDADLDHARWDRYRLEKRRLEDLGLEPHDYDAEFKRLMGFYWRRRGKKPDFLEAA